MYRHYFSRSEDKLDSIHKLLEESEYCIDFFHKNFIFL